MKLQLYLSHNGVCSRRKAFELIKSGSVKLNGKKVCEPSAVVDPDSDQVHVHNQLVEGKRKHYLLLNKPEGYVTTTAHFKGERSVMDLLPAEFKHCMPVGRLDKDTEGLLILTNDGDLHYRLTHPKFETDKKYFVRLRGQLSRQSQHKLEKGLLIDGVMTAPAKIEDVKVRKHATELLMTIHEGRKRQIRKMAAVAGSKVIYLRRVAQGPLTLGDLRKGAWRKLTQQEIFELQKI